MSRSGTTTTGAVAKTLTGPDEKKTVQPGKNDDKQVNEQKQVPSSEVAATPYPFLFPNETLDTHLYLNTEKFDQQLTEIKSLSKPKKYKKTKYDPNTGKVVKPGELKSDKSALVVDVNTGDEKNPTKVRRFLVGGKIGEGGFGKVRLLIDAETKKLYVVKLQPKWRRSLQEEKLTRKLKVSLASLERPKQPKGEDAKAYWQLMLISEYIPGVDLYDYCKHIQAHFSFTQKLDIALKMIDAVMRVHELGIMHCDITPNNFRYDPITGTVTLHDFGLAVEEKQPDVGIDGINYAHASPALRKCFDEKVNKYHFSKREDIYSLILSIGEVLGLTTVTTVSREAIFVLRDNLSWWAESGAAETLEKLKKIIANPEKMTEQTLPELRNFLEDVRDATPDLEVHLKKTAILNIDEFLQIFNNRVDNVGPYEDICNVLRRVNEVWITGPSAPYSERTLLQVRELIEKLPGAPRVGHTLFHNVPGGQLSAVDLAAQIPKKIDNSQSMEVRCFYLLTQTKLEQNQVKTLADHGILPVSGVVEFHRRDINHKVLEAIYKKINSALRRDNERMLEKAKAHPDKAQIYIDRSTAINGMLLEAQELFHTGKLTFQWLTHRLTQLQQQMKSDAAFCSPARTDSGKKIEKLITLVERNKPKKG